MPVYVEGLTALTRTFRRLGPETKKRLRDEMKEIGGIVADEGKRIAEQQGLRETGALINKIRPIVKGTAAVVRDNAVRTTGKGAPFSYPKLYEYVRGRAFLHPALKEKEPEVYARLEEMLDRLAGEF